MELRKLYLQQLREHGYQSDAVQDAVIGKLESLRTRLIEAHAQRMRPMRRLLTAIGRGSAPHAPRGLYLWGGVGRGKTWMMDLFYRSVPFPERRRRHFHRFMHEVHTALKALQQQDAPLEKLAAGIARDTQLLCFDELFVPDIADAMILGGLFAGLLRRGVTLVTTSNSPPHELYRDGLQRQRFLPTIQLLEQHLEVVAVEGATDYRLRRLTRAGTYLPVHSADTSQRLATLFTELTNDNQDNGHAAASIEVADRAVPVVRAGGGVVWFAFAAICTGPRSQDDYIEIARNYQAVIVEDVPVFDERLENEARRFIALVDELYDRRVKLIVSAAASPRELYRGNHLAAAFERTVSRLTEMQSAEYLAREHLP